MAFTLGIYDLFANLLPGSLYIALAIVSLNRFAGVPLDRFTEPTLLLLAIGGGAAYISGLVFDRLAKRWWYEPLKGRITYPEIIDSLNARNHGIKFLPHNYSWSLLHEYIKINAPENYVGLQRMGAIQILLRNVSFVSFLAAWISLADAIVSPDKAISVVAIISFCIISALALQQSKRFDDFHFIRTYETIAALQLEPQQLPAQPKPNSTDV